MLDTELGTIDLSKINHTTSPVWFPNDWRDNLTRNESARAKFIVLTAFGGQLPDHPKKDAVKYESYKLDGIKMWTGYPKHQSNRFWRGVKTQNNKINAEKIREKWQEVADAAIEAEKRKKRRKKKREENQNRNQKVRNFLAEKYDFGGDHLRYARSVSGEIGNKEVEIEIGSGKNIDVKVKNMDMGKMKIEMGNKKKMDMKVKDLGVEEMKELLNYLENDL